MYTSIHIYAGETLDLLIPLLEKDAPPYEIKEVEDLGAEAIITLVEPFASIHKDLPTWVYIGDGHCYSIKEWSTCRDSFVINITECKEAPELNPDTLYTPTCGRPWSIKGAPVYARFAISANSCFGKSLQVSLDVSVNVVKRADRLRPYRLMPTANAQQFMTPVANRKYLPVGSRVSATNAAYADLTVVAGEIANNGTMWLVTLDQAIVSAAAGCRPANLPLDVLHNETVVNWCYTIREDCPMAHLHLSGDESCKLIDGAKYYFSVKLIANSVPSNVFVLETGSIQIKHGY